ncbi:MAG: glutamine synthetase [Clostridiales bacterium]|nr:glutamine synthetase [Clostridiales bacterium]
MGIRPVTSHHEHGTGQNEIEFEKSNALECCVQTGKIFFHVRACHFATKKCFPLCRRAPCRGSRRCQME